jgi:hypothetical protein
MVVERVKPPEQFAVPPPPLAEAETQVTVTALAGTALQLALPVNTSPPEPTCRIQVNAESPFFVPQVTEVDGDPGKLTVSGSEAANETVGGVTVKFWIVVLPASGLTMAGVGWRGGFWPALKPAPANITTASKHPGRLM